MVSSIPDFFGRILDYTQLANDTHAAEHYGRYCQPHIIVF